ncbi:putative Blue (Type 1) copper domain protein [Verrucomicrobia bacterium]|nr:putative Blue (Type 1) copper domain protein [Verrucomicrobiota bacterium]
MRIPKHLSGLARLGLAVFSLIAPSLLWAATANISIGDNFFSPTATNINIGDQVKWTWIGTNFHSTTSDTGLWDSGIHAGGNFNFTMTFPTAGNFPFHCNVHSFMTGAVTVVVASTPPTVSLTNPPNGEILSASATVRLQASASSSTASVTNVQFFEGTASLGNVPTSPYSLTVSNLGAADYTFSAVATDSNGLTATNAVTIHVVTAAPLSLSAPQRLSATSFQLTYSATVGLRYLVQRSADLTSWSPINTNTAASNSVVFEDTQAVALQNFYRVELLPNP